MTLGLYIKVGISRDSVLTEIFLMYLSNSMDDYFSKRLIFSLCFMLFYNDIHCNVCKTNNFTVMIKKHNRKSVCNICVSIFCFFI